ncbi:hypothetical protein FOA52_015378 [Chlamydomonas sp. UWO 241]|nr:hypothetical protein FOA52_015378 [Chlamydomonas sp. UWO 241]
MPVGMHAACARGGAHPGLRQAVAQQCVVPRPMLLHAGSMAWLPRVSTSSSTHSGHRSARTSASTSSSAAFNSNVVAFAGTSRSARRQRSPSPGSPSPGNTPPAKPFYAVANGRDVGIFRDWAAEVAPIVNGVRGAEHQKFRSRHEAEAWLAERRGKGPSTSASTSSTSTSSRGGRRKSPPAPQLEVPLPVGVFGSRREAEAWLAGRLAGGAAVWQSIAGAASGAWLERLAGGASREGRLLGGGGGEGPSTSDSSSDSSSSSAAPAAGARRLRGGRSEKPAAHPPEVPLPVGTEGPRCRRRLPKSAPKPDLDQPGSPSPCPDAVDGKAASMQAVEQPASSGASPMPPSVATAAAGERAEGALGRKKSRFRGVGWDKRREKWEVRLWDPEVKGNQYIGRYISEEDAARAYDCAAVKMFGPGCKGRNFPGDVIGEAAAAQPNDRAETEGRTGSRAAADQSEGISSDNSSGSRAAAADQRRGVGSSSRGSQAAAAADQREGVGSSSSSSSRGSRAAAAADQSEGAGRFRLEFDGGSRGNPGVGGYGAVLMEEGPGGQMVHLLAGTMPIDVTNNHAEYLGLIEGMRAAEGAGARALTLVGDSQLVISQVTGKWRCSHAMMESLRDQVVELARSPVFIGGVSALHVLRAHNPRADALANLAQDADQVATAALCALRPSGHPSKAAADELRAWLRSDEPVRGGGSSSSGDGGGKGGTLPQLLLQLIEENAPARGGGWLAGEWDDDGAGLQSRASAFALAQQAQALWTSHSTAPPLSAAAAAPAVSAAAPAASAAASAAPAPLLSASVIADGAALTVRLPPRLAPLPPVDARSTRSTLPGALVPGRGGSRADAAAAATDGGLPRAVLAHMFVALVRGVLARRLAAARGGITAEGPDL